VTDAARLNPAALPMDRDQALANARSVPPGYAPREG
jgi:hypothetical protein